MRASKVFSILAALKVPKAMPTLTGPTYKIGDRHFIQTPIGGKMCVVIRQRYDAIRIVQRGLVHHTHRPLARSLEPAADTTATWQTLP